MLLFGFLSLAAIFVFHAQLVVAPSSMFGRSSRPPQYSEDRMTQAVFNENMDIVFRTAEPDPCGRYEQAKVQRRRIAGAPATLNDANTACENGFRAYQQLPISWKVECASAHTPQCRKHGSTLTCTVKQPTVRLKFIKIDCNVDFWECAKKVVFAKRGPADAERLRRERLLGL